MTHSKKYLDRVRLDAENRKPRTAPAVKSTRPTTKKNMKTAKPDEPKT